MDYSIALGNRMNPRTPLHGCGVNVRFCFASYFKSSYILRSVSVHWMYQKCSYHKLLQCTTVIMHYLNSFLSCSIRNLILSSSSRLFTIKIDAFFRFTSFNSHSGLFHESNY